MNIAINLIIAFFGLSLYFMIVEQNLFKKIFFLSTMQSSVIIYYIVSVWSPFLSTPFYISSSNTGYVDPVPQVLMLTAIVVGFATTALCLAVVVRIKRLAGTIMCNEIIDKDDNIEKDF